jgi:hypothetical protein
MQITNMPGCCTSAIIHNFGEHGEEAEVTVKNIERLLATKTKAKFDENGQLRENGKHCFFAITCSEIPGIGVRNLNTLKAVGFREVDSYQGVQGKIHILTLHA